MAGVHFLILLTYLSVLRTSYSTHDYRPVRMCDGDFEKIGRCFVSVDQNMDWHDADHYCKDSLLTSPTPSGIEQYGNLAAIEDPTSQNLVATEAANQGWDSTWINGCLKGRFWFWQKHWPPYLAFQGCWKDEPSNPDLPIVLTVTTDTKPSDCLAMCREMKENDPDGKEYVLGIQKDSAGNIACRCGANWNKKHGRSYSELCDGVCTGSGITMTGSVMDKYCGGYGHQLIYYLEGSEFYSFAPSTVRTYDHCIVMNPAHNYQWTEHDCHHPQPFICHYDISEWDCNQLRSYEWANGACVTLHMDPLSFYEAQGECAKHNGLLLKVENSDVHDAVKDLLDNVNKFYIALTGEEWIFSYWELMYKYFNWGSNQPAQGPGQDCFAIRRDDNYRWYNIDCHTPLPFMCMVDILEADEKPSSTTSTTTTTTNTIEQMNTVLPIGDKTETGGVSQELLIGVGAGVGGTVVIVVVILLCVYCCLRSKRQNRKRERQARSHHSKNRALPRPPESQRHRGAPVTNPSYEPDIHMGHHSKGGKHSQSVNDPHYTHSVRDRDTYHEYADLGGRNYDYIEPVHSKKRH